MDTSNLAMQPFTLAFKSAEIEGKFLGEVANKRWPVLIFIFCFDVLCFLFRFTAKLSSTNGSPDGIRPFEVVQEMGHQLANMAMLYVLIGLLNKRARKSGDNAARQEEVLLSICMGLAICNLLASLRTDNAQDYVYMSYFLICTSTFLKIRWWVGTGLLATPTLAVSLWYSSPAPSALLPQDAVVHIIVAWAVGGLMAYLSDWTRRQMYANAHLACAAHEKEMKEARARIQAQRELAAAQAQAAQRALTVAREKAAHEAKSEFMSLMCHEVRTPLNGCLASAEMLLETPLKEEQRELANTIRVSGSILLSTVSNFLDFFKLEAGKRLDIVRSELMMGDLVGDVHCIIEAMMGRVGPVTLHTPQLQGVPQVVYCDPDRLRGVLLNLYTNAAKFTKRGHILLRVRCVSQDWVPPAPPGYHAIILQPSYLPSSSADRSMDMSAHVILPAQQGSLPEGSMTYHTHSSKGLTDALQPQPTTEAHHDLPSGQQQQSLAACPAPREQQQQLPFWQQASQWACSFLPLQEQELDLTVSLRQQQDHHLSGSSSSSSSSLTSLEVSPDCQAGPHPRPHTDDTARNSPTSSQDQGLQGANADTAEALAATDNKRGQQIDVHAISSSSKGTAQPVQQQQQVHAQEQQQQHLTSQSAGLSACGSMPRIRRNSLASAEDACWLLFEVEDTGVGITRDGLASLFREYVQGTEDEMCKPRTRGGTGLGLSICSKQVAVLGGVIGAYSCRGRGSNFWFKIPVRTTKLGRTSSNTSSGSVTAAAAAAKHPQQQQQEQQLAGAKLVGVGQREAKQGDYTQSSLYQLSSSTSNAPKGCSGTQQQGSKTPGSTDNVLEGSYKAGAATTADALAGAALASAAAASSSSSQLPPTAPGPPTGAAATSGAAQSSSMRSTSSSGARSRQLSLDGKPPAFLDTSRLVGKRALLAEDNLINQTVARKMLNSIGMHVEVACNGAEAVAAVLRTREAQGNGTNAQLQQTGSPRSAGPAHHPAAASCRTSGDASSNGQPFAIILMDMAMPVMGGVEATRALREAGFTLPIVAMTANASDKDRDECAAAGMNGFLSKPVLRDQLARAMLAAVEAAEKTTG